MSTPDDAASRLSSALDEVFSSGPPRLPARRTAAPGSDDTSGVPEPTADTSDAGPPDADHGGPVALPKIVPATAHAPATEQVTATAPPAPPVTQRRVAPVARAAPPVAPVPQQPTTPAVGGPTPPTRPTTTWSDHMSSAPAPGAAVGANLRAPGRRPRVRRVTRVLRHIDPWSTFKVALLFSLVAYVVTLTSGVLLWRVADSTGTLDNVERWFTQFGWETFELKGGEIFHNAWIIGLFGAVALTGGLVLLATLFNLVSDIVGGVRMTVLEEEVVERTVSSTRRYVVRRPPVGTAAPGAPTSADWDVDGDDEPEPASAPPAVSAPPGGDNVAHPVADWSVDDD